MNRETISVSALNRYVKALIDNDEVLSQVWVEGELSGVHIHSASGHIYFKAVDGDFSVKCVMFRSYAEQLRFVPKDGMKVLLRCRVSLYEKTGDFQLYVTDIVEAGQGKRKTDFDVLKAKLEQEGLFSQERKRRLPPDPSNITLITSATGAVLHDIYNVTSRRNPFVHLNLVPVNVQGVFAAQAMQDAIDFINASDAECDLVIIARGGGSADDLWVFNDEGLVRKAAELRYPFISAVGHETDFTLLDFVADLRAPTPSAAAELAVPDVGEWFEAACSIVESMGSSVQKKIENGNIELKESADALDSSAVGYIEGLRNVLDRSQKLCDSLSPLRVLERGYSYTSKEGRTVRSISQIAPGDGIEITFRDGRAACTVDGVHKDE